VKFVEKKFSVLRATVNVYVSYSYKNTKHKLQITLW